MLKKIILAVTIFTLTIGFSVITGCEKREYHKHVEKQQHDFVIDEGPVVEQTSYIHQLVK